MFECMHMPVGRSQPDLTHAFNQQNQTTCRQALRAQRLVPFPQQSTERFSALRGKVDKATLPKGPNGCALCRLCQVC